MTDPLLTGAAAVGAEGAKALLRAQEGSERRKDADHAVALDATKGTAELAAVGHLRGRRMLHLEAFKTRLVETVTGWFGVNSEYLRDRLPEDLAAKLADVPVEELQEPRPAIAYSALEGLMVTADESSLREMYVNLLAAASTSTRASGVHPSFPSVIKDLMPEEAPILDICLRQGRMPLAQITRTNSKSGGFIVVETYVLQLLDSASRQPVRPPNLNLFCDNWVRLGLVEMGFDHHFTDEAAYDWVTGRPEWAAVVRDIMASETLRREEVLDFRKGLLQVTARGQSFLQAVSDDTRSNNAASSTS